MRNGLLGGEASIWSGRMVNIPNVESDTRPRQRRHMFELMVAQMRREFGGIGPHGHYYYPVGMNRRQSRAIARARSKGQNVRTAGKVKRLSVSESIV